MKRHTSPDAALLRLTEDYIAADKKWRGINAKENRTKGLGIQRKLERESTAALNVLNGLLVKIERRKALTLAGILAKAKVASIEGTDDVNFAGELGLSMARDLLALKAGAQVDA